MSAAIVDSSGLAQALHTARATLLNARITLPEGGEQCGETLGFSHWVGELSSSALSTATAVCALSIYLRESAKPRQEIEVLIENGLTWLARFSNNDGGWGDTIKSISNISTTALCWAAFGVVPGADHRFSSTVDAAVRWLEKVAGGITPEKLAPGIIHRYGKDRTFSVPILTMCNLAGRLGNDGWKYVIPLPFELAALPQTWFAALHLPVVSYALPALIAIGQARHFHYPTRNPITRLLRNISRRKTLGVLNKIQPSSGGFLEATPLTSFVAMSLAASGQVENATTSAAVEFLIRSARDDGSWPIDTNLCTWVTTLAINALGDSARELLSSDERERIIQWLLKQQYREIHPYTNAPPGGWAWTDLPGGVPDADDTAGALLALHNLGPVDTPSLLQNHIALGIQWLLNLQNSDGGIPTFCRGWTNLPFDRSSPDITAHVLRAWKAWLRNLPVPLQKRVQKGAVRAVQFLLRTQTPEGTWIPLWFGNQWDKNDENHVYGTTKAIFALAEWEDAFPAISNALRQAASALLRFQKENGSWTGACAQDGEPLLGADSSIEETALALEALATLPPGDQTSQVITALHKGTEWLLQQIQNGNWTRPSPVGFYFARLWYYERLYPIISTVGALERLRLTK